MNASPLLPPHWFRPRLAACLFFFAITFGLTFLLRTWHLDRVEATISQRQGSQVSKAQETIDEAFGRTQHALLAHAQKLAKRPEVVEALQTFSTAAPSPSPAAIQLFSSLSLPDLWSAEVFTPTLDLVAWSGVSIPLNEWPAATPFSHSVRTAIAQDDAWRQALVVWYPVVEEGQTLGAIRMTQLLHRRTPVRNTYLRDYDIINNWRQSTELHITASFTPGTIPKPDSTNQLTNILYGLDGTRLGYVTIEKPLSEDLIQSLQKRYDDVLAFWTVLFLFGLMAFLWSWYRHYDDSNAVSGPSLFRTAGRLALWGIVWWGLRFLLFILEVPARWQPDKSPLSPLFDATHLASTFGGGLLRSTGDLFITACFWLCFVFALLFFSARFIYQPASSPAQERRLGLFGLQFAGVAVPGFGLTLLLASVVEHVILDSTLTYAAREGLLPKPLVLVVFCSLLVLMLGVVLLIAAGAWLILHRYRAALMTSGKSRLWLLRGSALVLIPLVGLYVYFQLNTITPWYVCLGVFATGLGAAIGGVMRQGSNLRLLTLRSILLSVFVISLLLYPMLQRGLDVQRRQRMKEAAELFREGQDPSVFFAIEQLLDEAHNHPQSLEALTHDPLTQRFTLDSLSTVLLRRSRLASLGSYDLSLLFLSPQGNPLGRYDASDEIQSRLLLDQYDREQFEILEAMYAERGLPGPMVEPVTGRRESARFRYEGILPFKEPAADTLAGWAMVRAEPHSFLSEDSTPFLRVLLPSVYGNLYGNLSLAEFREGVLLRSFGRDFGRYILDETVQSDLATQAEFWRKEQVTEHKYLTYYKAQALATSSQPVLTPITQVVIATRVPMSSTFDHLYYLLRLTVAGLFVGAPFYLMGLLFRRRAGMLPARRTRFRDKVLNAFLAVGIVTVTAVGFIGVSVITGENERAVQSWLRQHLQRAEETLALEGLTDEMPYRVLERIPLDSLAARVGLDLNLYENGHLIAASRPQLIQERLIDARLPIQAYQSLYQDGYKFSHVEEHLGSFTYTAGYWALLDEQRQPRYVLALPTLPEQERIEEERARTVAYLFGALLLLVIVVMGTASILASALSHPIVRLRLGLEEAARGHFERTLPVTSTDEVGELVETFNAMQDQLAESRRQLAHQERQLAWREMARQVAHEIKNPLTPMKLSVQHLRRAFFDVSRQPDAHTPLQNFTPLFERITNTLVEQIDSLARIANEFSSFARMPTRVLERLDLNVVIREAVSLMEAEAGMEISMQLHSEPLVLEADKEELRRVFINLLKNALQALPQHGGQVRVTTTYLPPAPGRSALAYSTVSDTGLGIPLELQDKIFEPNFSTKTSGTGLGLAITRKTILELHGEIDFDTQEGSGTTFHIRLPVI